jgi:transcription antitermination factor NusG
VILGPIIRSTTGPILCDGELRWYALMVRPQREEAARVWLERYRVVSFYPVTDAKRMRRGKPVHYERKYLPGYLFAQFPGEPIWHVLLSSPFVRDVIRLHNGTPGILHPDTLTRLHAMRKMDMEIETKRRYRKMIRVGDRVKVKRGAMEGWEVEVVEIDAAAGKAKFALQLLGACNAEIEIDGLEKL